MRINYVIIVTKRASATASLNRMELIQNGLLYHGVSCRTLCLTPYFQNIKYIRYIGFLALLLKLIIHLISARKKDIFIFYGEYTFLSKFKKFKKKGVKWIIERNEYSTYQIREHLPEKYIQKIKQFEHNLYCMDGLITCSSYLEDYYKNYLSGDSKSIIIPMVIDVDFFKDNIDIPEKYIAYCGDFGGNKDGLPVLLEAFAKIKDKYSDYKLCLIGDTADQNSMHHLKMLIKRLELSDRLIMPGRVPHSAMPEWLGNASVLVLARPANKQAEGGIPSKLAEYLATGRPTLVTRVGELDHYFTDQEDLFFAEPDSINDFASKLNFILTNYNNAEKIGKKGQERIKEFDYKIQASVLKQYLLGISNS